MTPEREKLIERIAKLLALATSDNQHEAELALAKANEMMQEHQIAMSEVQSEQEREEDYDQTLYEISGVKVFWLYQLARACAELYDGECINVPYTKGKTSFYFVATPSNVEIIKATFIYMYKVQQNVVVADLEAYRDDWRDKVGANLTPGETMKFKHGHGVGFANAIRNKVYQLVKKRKAHLKQHSETTNALVIVSEKKLKDYMDMNSKTNNRRNYSDGSGAGRAAGDRAGQKIDLEAGTIGKTRMIAR